MSRSIVRLLSCCAALHALASTPAAAQGTPGQPADAARNAASQAAGAAAPRAQIDYRSVAEALAALKARDGDDTVVTSADGWYVVNEPLAKAQWSFTPPGHPAHPALVRRSVRRSADGQVSIETTSLCEAAEAACAQLLADFEGLNDRISQSIRSRSRPPPALPR